MTPKKDYLQKVQVAAKEHPEAAGAAIGALLLGFAVPVIGHAAGAAIGAAAGAVVARRMSRRELE